MPVVTNKSAAITNRDAVPKVLNMARTTGAPLLVAYGTVAVANLDSIGSKYIFCSLPSNAMVADVKLTSADIGTTFAADFGIYKNTQDGGAAVDVDLFGSAVSLNGGALSKSSITHESTVYPYTSRNMPLWQALGLSADPGLIYDVVATATAASDAAGTMLLEVEYTV